MQRFKIDQNELPIMESVMNFKTKLVFDETDGTVSIADDELAQLLDELYNNSEKRSLADGSLFIKELLEKLVRQEKNNVTTPVLLNGMEQPVL